MTTESQQDINTNTGEISLKELILKIKKWRRYLLSKWIIILAFGLIGGGLGFWYASFKKPIYTATTTFVLEDEKGGGGLGNLAGLASMAGVDLGGGGGIFQGENIFELYKSRRMVVQTLLTKFIYDGKSQLLIDRYISFNEIKNRLNKNENLDFSSTSLRDGDQLLKPDRFRDSILNDIAADITKNYLVVEKQDKKLSIIRVDIKAPDEIFAKQFNEVIVRKVNEFYVNTKTKRALENVKILQRKTDSVRSVMNGAIFKAAEVADATPNLNPTRQVMRNAPVQRSQFTAETNKAILSNLTQNLEMSKITLVKEAPLIQVVDEPIYPLKVTVYNKMLFLASFSIIASIIAIICLIINKIYKQQVAL